MKIKFHHRIIEPFLAVSESICGTSTMTSSQVYISTDGYPDIMPYNTDQDCRCTIQGNRSAEQNIAVVAIYLQLHYEGWSKLCRENLTIHHKGNDIYTLCPHRKWHDDYSFTRINETLLMSTVTKNQSMQIQLMARRTTSSLRGKFLLSITSPGDDW